MDKNFNQFISCDWGTSSFRLRLISLPNFEMLGEVKNALGIRESYQKWQESGRGEPERGAFYQEVILKNLQYLEQKIGQDLKEIPIICSGMISSTIGMKSLPYSQLPFSLDGKNALVEKINWATERRQDLWLISGVQSENDVMRGEETQLAGIAHLMPNFPESCTVILPGTHSKHLYIKDKTLQDFHTFMTGEVFEVLTKHSILSASLSFPTSHEINWEYFERGLTMSDQPVLSSIFTVRTNAILHQINHEANYYYLSGLLIGQELQYLPQNQPIVFFCEGVLGQLYKKGLHFLGNHQDLHEISPEMLSNVTAIGQWSIISERL
jgi:2-dehydro-3-deoxygalactonokinase